MSSTTFTSSSTSFSATTFLSSTTSSTWFTINSTTTTAFVPDANADVSVVVLGVVLFVMLVFYMVNSPHPGVADQAWNLVSTAVSIFCAVLVNDIVNDYISWIVAYDANSFGEIVSYGVQWVIWWYVVVFSLYLMRDSVLHLKAYGTIFGHILGFAGINFFGAICISSPFKDSPWMELVVLAIYLVAFVILFASSILFRKLKEGSPGVDAWHDQTKDTSKDFLCMTGSYILSYFVRYLIIDPAIPSVDGSEDGRPQSDWLTLLLVALVCTILCGIFQVVRIKVKPNADLMDIASTTVALLAAWCALFGTNWAVFNYGGGTVLNRFFVAEIFSGIAYCFVMLTPLMGFIGCDMNVLTGELTAISLTVGMGWEKTFDSCMDGLADYMGGSAADSRHVELFLFLLVFPAWVVYILVKTDDELKKLPPQHIWAALPCVHAETEEDLESESEADAREIPLVPYPRQ